MRRALFAAAVSLLLAVAAPPAGADAVPNPGLGDHVLRMAPEHPVDRGAGFGQCVSTMATTGTCPEG